MPDIFLIEARRRAASQRRARLFWPIEKQLAEAFPKPPFVETIDPETGEITSTLPHRRRRRRKLAGRAS
jgi:hypothetical protein